MFPPPEKKRVLPVLLLICLIAAFAGGAAAEDGGQADLPPPESAAGPDVADVFDFSQAVRPRPGDWLEYRIAFPADPLENSLEADPAPVPGAPAVPPPPPPPGPESSGGGTPSGEGGDGRDSFPSVQPVFEPPAPWRTVPVRLEIREVDDGGCNAVVTFGGESRTVRLPASGQGAQADFHYDEGEEAERAVRVGGREYPVREVRRRGPGYGFVRWFSGEVPFGTVRFATEHVDVQLVAVGRGTPPDFPVRVEDDITPELGILH